MPADAGGQLLHDSKSLISLGIYQALALMSQLSYHHLRLLKVVDERPNAYCESPLI